MSKVFRNRFLTAVVVILILGYMLGGNSALTTAVTDALSELPFIGQTWDIATKVVGVTGGNTYSPRSVWDDIVRSVFVALASIPFQRLFGLIFGFHYTGSETYDTPLSFGNRMRDFLYAGLAILVASSLFLMLPDLLAQIMPGIPAALRVLFLCIILAVVDYVFFKYSMSSLRLPVYLNFISGIIITILEVQFIVFLICLFIAGLQNSMMITLLLTILLGLAGITIMLKA